MLWFDYLLFLLPGMLLSTWAQVRILRASAEGSRIPAGSGLSGAETAELVMRAGGVTGVGVEPAEGELSDHYDPRNRVLRLSRGVYAGRSLAAMGVASHEAGHAIQHASGYPGLIARNAIVPVASLGSQVFWMLIAAGLLLGMFRLIIAGIALFTMVVLLQVLNLPAEFDASRRGRQILLSAGLVSVEEEPVVARILSAAAWTYVATALTGAVAMVGDLVRFGPIVRRRDEE
jgi:Zn-dependent membrane protease YugP